MTGGWDEEPGSAKLPTGHEGVLLCHAMWQSDDQEEWLVLAGTERALKV